MAEVDDITPRATLLRGQGYVNLVLDCNYLTSFLGILLDDVHYMIEQARPGTELHQAINAGFELVIDHPNSLPSESVYNIWPFVAWRFFWELQFCISIKVCSQIAI